MFKFLSALFLTIFVLAPIAKSANRIVLTTENIIYLHGEVNETSVNTIIVKLQSNPEGKFLLYINSPGGEIFAGNHLIDVMKAYKGQLDCYADFAASMAFAIFQTCQTRYLGEGSLIMQHVASYTVRGQAPNNISFVSYLERALKNMDDRQAKRIGLSLDDFRSKTRGDWWLDGKSAVEEKAADQVILINCSTDLTSSSFVETEMVSKFQVNLTYSGCPIIREPIDTELVLPEGSPAQSKARTARILEIAKERATARPTDSESLDRILNKHFSRVR